MSGLNAPYGAWCFLTVIIQTVEIMFAMSECTLWRSVLSDWDTLPFDDPAACRES